MSQGGHLLRRPPKTAQRIPRSPSGPTMAFLVGHLYWAILSKGVPGVWPPSSGGSVLCVASVSWHEARRMAGPV